MKPIDRRRFDALAGYTRSPISVFFMRELAWYKQDDETLSNHAVSSVSPCNWLTLGWTQFGPESPKLHEWSRVAEVWWTCGCTAHAWKAISARLTERYWKTSSRNRFNDFRHTVLLDVNPSTSRFLSVCRVTLHSFLHSCCRSNWTQCPDTRASAAQRATWV